MNHYYHKFLLLFPLFAIAGCTAHVVKEPVSPPASERVSATEKTPPATPAVETKKQVAVEQTAAKMPLVPLAKPKPMPPKKILPPPAPQPKPLPPKRPRPSTPEKFRRGPGMWHEFSRLSPNDQQELMRLQRKDPEKFRTIMQEKADQLYARERARRQELADLAKKCRESSDNVQKNKLKNELREKLRLDFQQRLQDNRRNLESNRKRLNRMEAELKKREKNSDAIIEAILIKYLTDPADLPRDVK